MANFNYTLPSGSTFQLSAPDGTTQAQADQIFYEQVAAGTFVGYNVGDSISHPQEALQNFGISRLQRGTAGVPDQTLVAITNGLPTVAPVPNLTAVPVQNAISTVDYIQVTSNPITGIVGTGPNAIGTLSSTDTQALMAQIAAMVNQPVDTLSPTLGVGKYGFSTQQLERSGHMKPGYSEMYCPFNITTQTYPSNYMAFMNSPTPWTGVDGVNSIQVILNSEALQNKIQEQLMASSYDAFVSVGMIVPSTANNTPSLSTGQVYTANGSMVSATVDTILNTKVGT